MKGKAYGVGAGPGDPELMTLKACRLIRENDVIAVPGREPKESVAYKIAAAAAPELSDKELVAVEMPMLKDPEALRCRHKEGARRIEAYLDQGKNVVFLTLGDPTIYCSFQYLKVILEEDGYETELVNGISSINAAAARLNIPLAEWDEPLHVFPAAHNKEADLTVPGTCVIMKAASRMKEVKDRLQRSGKQVMAVENCGMENERIYRGAGEIPDEAGYLTLIIAKNGSAGREL